MAPTEVQCSHILVKHAGSRNPRSWRSEKITRSKEEAEWILKGMRSELAAISDDSQRRKRFAEIASKFSDCSCARNGGDLGPFGRGQAKKPFEDASFALNVGQMSGVVDTDSGLDLILRMPLERRQNVNFVPKGPLTHLRVQNEMMLVVMSGRKLQHIRLQNGETTDIPVPLAEEDRIANIHLDYNGAHAILSTTTGENFYLNMGSVELKPLKRLKGTVTAVGWNLEYSRESETGFIVLGTNKGQLTETNISASGTMAYVKTLVADVSEGKAFAVTDLQMHQQSEDTRERWALLVCTTGRLYVLAGAVDIKAATQPQPQPVDGTVPKAAIVKQQGGVLQPLFSGREHPPFLSLNAEKHTPRSELAVYPIVSTEPPKYYCLLSSEGLRLGSIDVSKAAEGTEMLVEEAQLEHKRVEGRFDYPLDIAITEHHLLMLHSDRFVALSRLNQKTAFKDNFDAKTAALGMCRDATSQFTWVFTESVIFKYRPFEGKDHVEAEIDSTDSRVPAMTELFGELQLQKKNANAAAADAANVEDDDTPTVPGKVKRIRSSFSDQQLLGLEERFKEQSYLERTERIKLADTLGLSPSKVTKWFQNRRTKKPKKPRKVGKKESSVSVSGSDHEDDDHEGDDHEDNDHEDDE